MNAPRASADDYIAYLVATPKEAAATEMARCQPITPDAPSHDAFTRLLTRLLTRLAEHAWGSRSSTGG